MFALGLISQRGELEGMGIAYLEDASKKRAGSISWFQRDVSPRADKLLVSLIYDHRAASTGYP